MIRKYHKKRGGKKVRKMSKTHGYTLIELMIVIVIIGILSTIILPHMVKGRYQAQFTSCIFNLRSIASALENYHTDKGTYPAESDWDKIYEGEGGNPPYINPEPLCPSNKSRYGYEVSSDGHNYTIYCNGIHHLIIKSVARGYPQYNAAIGLIPTQEIK